MTPRTPRLTVWLVTAAAAALSAAWLLRGGFVGFTLDRLFIGIGVVAVAQWARIRVRVGGGNARLAWGEAALVVRCAIEPASAVPLTTATALPAPV